MVFIPKKHEPNKGKDIKFYRFYFKPGVQFPIRLTGRPEA
jgi:hypothetical protein